MASSINFEEAKEKFIANHRMQSEAPGTFPHVLDWSLKPEQYRGKDGLSYLVNNGRTTEEKGWVYETNYPA